MVLVLAALYTYYQQVQEEKRRKQERQQQEGEEGDGAVPDLPDRSSKPPATSGTSNGGGSSSFQQQQQQHPHLHTPLVWPWYCGSTLLPQPEEEKTTPWTDSNSNGRNRSRRKRRITKRNLNASDAATAATTTTMNTTTATTAASTDRKANASASAAAENGSVSSSSSAGSNRGRRNGNKHNNSNNTNFANGGGDDNGGNFREQDGYGDDDEVFKASVREEWINAVFGPEFATAADRTATGTAPKTTRGVGLSGIESYVAYSVRIPKPPAGGGAASAQKEEPGTPSVESATKVGMTMSRLPIGLYVYRVDTTSEAYFAGVREGSVLISVNGVPFLAEPSRQALERIWQYEGLFLGRQQQQHQDDRDNGFATPSRDETNRNDQSYSNNNTASSKSNTPTSSNGTSSFASTSSSGPSYRITEPVALEFIHEGRISTYVMLSNPPWGITWAPCGNFCLVKRVYSHAADAGVKKGSLVVSVNADNNSKNTFRGLDHADMAMTIRDEFTVRDLNIMLCFTPAAARTGHYERKLKEENGAGTGGKAVAGTSAGTSGNNTGQNVLSSPRASWIAKSHDGVEVKFHPIELAIGSLCSATMGFGMKYGGSNSAPSVVEELAANVAAGRMTSPVGVIAADSDLLLVRGSNRLYSPCPALPGERLFELWDPLDALLYCLRLHAAQYDEERFSLIMGHAQQNKFTPAQAIRYLAARPYGSDIVGSYLLQFLGIICAPEESDTPDFTGGIDSNTEDEKKMDDCADDRQIQLQQMGKGTAHALTSILLKVSRKDEGFCQRLYFLLRSYISTLEAPRPQSHGDDGSRNLVALLNCLELLRFAEKELAGRMNAASTMSQSASEDLLDTTSDTLDEALSNVASNSGVELPLHPSSPRSPGPSSPTRSLSAQSPKSTNSKSKKKLFGRFRKKKQSQSQSHQQPLLPQLIQEQSPLLQGASSSYSIGSRSPKATKSIGSPRRNKSKAKIVPVKSRSTQSLTQSPSVMYENMSDFLGELDRVCGTIERSLQKSFRQKMADWAMQPWSPSKDSALAEVTAIMRNHLKEVGSDSSGMLLVNPVDSSELLSSLDHDECYILPSAHFPILLTFNVSERRSSDVLNGEERLYRTKVELVSLKGHTISEDRSFVLHAAVAGRVYESGTSRRVRPESDTHIWQKKGVLIFDARSSWGAPQTLSLRVSSKVTDSLESGYPEESEEIGYGWVDLSAQFNMSSEQTTTTCYAEVWPVDSQASSFDEHGDLPNDASSNGTIELKLRITTESIGFGDVGRDGLTRKRMLLYKHDDDLRQEAFAVQFINTCDAILKSSGLDMKLLTFHCIPVGTRRGFVEWVPGSVPLSEICQPFSGSIFGNSDRRTASDVSSTFPSMFTKAGLTKYESLRRLGGQQNESLRRLSGNHGSRGSFSNNPIQDYLRSVAYDPYSPYLIRRDVMDTYVKSCAGYSVIAYVLGVGDRHLDNLLLHQSGSFFHCDYSFILGSDPKTYLPVRVTEDMVYGMGGAGSDNYARFLSMVGAAFLCLRRPENVRVLLSMVRLMEYSRVPDISENQTADAAVAGIRSRLRLELSDRDAVAYVEGLVESSQSSKMWIAVDAIHNLGKALK